MVFKVAIGDNGVMPLFISQHDLKFNIEVYIK